MNQKKYSTILINTIQTNNRTILTSSLPVSVRYSLIWGLFGFCNLVKWDNCPTYKILLEEIHLRLMLVWRSTHKNSKTSGLVWHKRPLPLILVQSSFYDETHQYCICSVHTTHNRELTVCSAKKIGLVKLAGFIPSMFIIISYFAEYFRQGGGRQDINY